MDQYHKTRESILSLNDRIRDLVRQTESVLASPGEATAQLIQTCDTISRHLIDHVVRIAVVGAIKSGKSTLVNGLLQDDYLKRGAGVVTSIVTRVRRGDKLQAQLFFKSWDEVNTEIEQALVLFPSGGWHADHDHFDIRRSKDRSDLRSALDSLDAEMHVANDSLNANSVLLSSYLKGFETVEHFVGAEQCTKAFEAGNFSEHRKFVGEDKLAVYLKDIQLDIDNESLDSNIEMADCQGSDSPNPLHMAMIQDYLLKAHLIVYVISSRTGLRQADIRFLSIIKQMGIAENILFVCNCDINEHESLSDLQDLVEKIREELSLVLPSPELFVFSALFHLFDARQTELSERDGSRLAQWKRDPDMMMYSEMELKRLKSVLACKLTRERSALLLQNQIERIDVVRAELRNWIRLNQNLLRKDAGEAQGMAERVKSHQGYMRQVQSMIRGTLDGGIQSISKELKNEIDRFFDRHSGPVLENVIGFIQHYHVDLNSYRQQAVSSGFTQTLYLVFQEFRQALDTHMAETINPEIVGFIGKLEHRLKQYLHSVVEPYEAMVRDAIHQYEETLSQFNLDQIPVHKVFDTVPNLDDIKSSIGLALPSAAATMRYSAHIKTDAVMRLGIYALLRVMRKVLKKPSGAQGDEAIKALKDGIRRMKRETLRSINAHFIDYRENVKFQYMLRLAEASSSRLFEGLSDHFRMYLSDLKGLIDSMGVEREDKEQLSASLGAIETKINRIGSQMDGLRVDIQLLRGKDQEPQDDLETGTGGI
jgi:GTPase SAR1 family protein